MPQADAAIPATPDRVSRSRVPAAARRLRLPLHQRSQARMRERWGFDLDAPDAQARTTALAEQHPDDADTHLLMAAVLASRGSNDGALAAARTAVGLDPTSARGHTTLATLLVAAGRAEEGLEHACRAAELDPADPAVRYNRGLLLTGVDAAQARADFDAAAQLLGLAPLPRWRRWWGA